MKAEERRDLYLSVFGSDHGRKVLEDLNKYTNFKNSSFDVEPLKMAKKEGLKDVIRYINKQLEAR